MAVPALPRALTTACHLAAWVVLALACVGAAIVPGPAAGALPNRAIVQSGEPKPRVIDITAKRFAFEPAVVEVVAGEPVRLVVRSADGVHGIGIDRLDITKVIPRGGEAVTIDFVATEPGRFPIMCTEYCGSGHEDMTGMLVVHARQPAGDTVRLQE